MSYTGSHFIVGEKTINELSSDDYSDCEDNLDSWDSNEGNCQLKINLLLLVLHNVTINKK